MVIFCADGSRENGIWIESKMSWLQNSVSLSLLLISALTIACRTEIDSDDHVPKCYFHCYHIYCHCLCLISIDPLLNLILCLISKPIPVTLNYCFGNCTFSSCSLYPSA
ncbi:hypothetical protein COLO4_21323 [Corchorus olitorius]|uniref:Uncharacterized protein n=1 Tax=Corchorus olitorius TaxID=93759 RepID=A0A1R3IU62_9ROSI|nr:hypothetical protein COLO4_21323 [Corchorus olitorius]